MINDMLQDNSGGTSSARVAMIVTIGVVLAVWCAVSLKTGAMADIPQSVLTLALGTSALKVAQRFGEKPTPTTT